MKRILLSILFVLVTTMTSFAQKNYQDVVYLKNGSIIRGVIIEQIFNKSIKIQTVDDNVFVFEADDVEKITKEPSNRRLRRFNPGGETKSDYVGILEIGHQFGVGDLGINRFNFNIVNGVQLNPHFSLGLGTGLRYYFDADAAVIPVFIDFRANLLDKDISPYFSLGFGYSFDATNNFKGVGILFNPILGISCKISRSNALNFGVGYESQSMDFYYYGGYGTVKKGSGAVCLNFGVSF